MLVRFANDLTKTSSDFFQKLGCCHSDIHVRDNDWGSTRTPLIAGHEGVGYVVAIGANTVGSPVKVGDRVGTKWVANACLKYAI